MAGQLGSIAVAPRPNASISRRPGSSGSSGFMSVINRPLFRSWQNYCSLFDLLFRVEVIVSLTLERAQDLVISDDASPAMPRNIVARA
ncbi:hypothetical protein AM571_CH00327 [Rhizobium etli 8C-3]|uniref:Uncharacterized protein n=1 Tax=Rhizobium etli 8C-3 TaxID=538025 RepID=A0A1L5NZ78_RHIET|nr:hypothetical protein AM571_CH00327 [Rhizobium etli 8C-3]